MKTVETKLRQRHVEWLGHLAGMRDVRLPKMCLFVWLPHTGPCGGPRRRWRDMAKKDLKARQVGKIVTLWRRTCRGKWRSAWSHFLAEHLTAQQRG